MNLPSIIQAPSSFTPSLWEYPISLLPVYPPALDAVVAAAAAEVVEVEVAFGLGSSGHSSGLGSTLLEVPHSRRGADLPAHGTPPTVDLLHRQTRELHREVENETREL